MWGSPSPEPLTIYQHATVWGVLVLSEVLAVFVVRQAWRSQRSILEKLLLTACAIVPVVGVFFAWWLQNDPGPCAPAFRDYRKYQTNVLHRWLHVFQERNPREKARKYAELVQTNRDDV